MSETTFSHVSKKIAESVVNPDPFSHFYISDIFPRDFYWEMLENLPHKDRYTLPPRVINAAPERLICDADKLSLPFWDELTKWFLSNDFAQVLIDKFHGDFVKRYREQKLRFGSDTRLVRDYENYQIKPHTDTPLKAISLLFYLPTDSSMEHLGTSVFVPKDPAFRCEGQKRHPFEQFEKVYTAPFLPNSVFGFFKTDYSFHGVEPIKAKNIERNVFLYNLYAGPC